MKSTSIAASVTDPRVGHRDLTKTFLQKKLDTTDQSVELDRNSRIYVMFRDQFKNKAIGRFIKGKRKQAPWTGYGTKAEAQEDHD